jgi:hypothetical protein
MHRQLEEILDALGRHQVVCYIGARGTGKSLLTESLEAQLTASGVTVVRMNARDVAAPNDLLDPLAAAAGVDREELATAEFGSEMRVRVLIDDAHEFHRHSWFQHEQEEWRSLLSRPEARGRIALFLAGRPLFRTLVGGNGSPLLNLGVTVVSRPVAHDDPGFASVDAKVLEAHTRKTGGHPQLTLDLLQMSGCSSELLASATARLASERRRYILRLVEDHALAARGVLADVIEAGGTPVSTATLIARHFGSSISFAHDCFADLAGTGLLRLRDEQLTSAAALLNGMGEVRSFLRAPAADFPSEATGDQAAAAAELFSLENKLRSVVAIELGAVDSAWWPSRVPDTLVAEAELRRKAEAESLAESHPDAHPLLFLTTGELFDLILTRANWGGVFQPALGITKHALVRAMEDILAVRNKVAHNRPVAPSDLALALAARAGLGRRFRDTNNEVPAQGG